MAKSKGLLIGLGVASVAVVGGAIALFSKPAAAVGASKSSSPDHNQGGDTTNPSGGHPILTPAIAGALKLDPSNPTSTLDPEISVRTLSGSGTVIQWNTQPNPLLSKGQTFALIGDSTGTGLEAPLGKLIKTLPGNYIANNISGYNIRQWLNELTPSDYAGANIVGISLGSNDQALFTPAAEGPYLDEFIAKIQASGRQMVWFMPPILLTDNPTQGQSVTAQMITAACAKNHISMVLPQKLAMSDAIHPNGIGYQSWAQAIFEALTVPAPPSFVIGSRIRSTPSWAKRAPIAHAAAAPRGRGLPGWARRSPASV